MGEVVGAELGFSVGEEVGLFVGDEVGRLVGSSVMMGTSSFVKITIVNRPLIVVLVIQVKLFRLYDMRSPNGWFLFR